MKKTEQSILQAFKDNPSKEFDTSQLAAIVFNEEYSRSEEFLASVDKEKILEGKRQKFQLHRKLLYYLNKLVEQKILQVTRIIEKGEKIFALAIGEGDITLEKGYKKIIITKPAVIDNNIESYERAQIMKRYSEDTLITKFNAILLESRHQNIEKLYQLISECFKNVNDVIALNEFESVLEDISNMQGKQDALRSFLEKLSEDTQNFDKVVSIIINVSETNHNMMRLFVEIYTEIKPRAINVVFNMNNRELHKNSDTLHNIIENFSKNKIKINIKNRDLDAAPYFKGRAGVYNFEEEEWKMYVKNIKGNTIGLVCSQSCIAININRFFELYRTPMEFRNAIINAAKTLLSASNIQARKSGEYFRNINSLNQKPGEFYKIGRSYIRFWNYDWHKDISENTHLFELIKSAKSVIENFCYTEETIFKSCGIPIRFRIVFSSAFRNFDHVFMGERDYQKANVKSLEDFYTEDMKKFIDARERLFELLEGGDRFRIFRTGNPDPKNIIHEWSIILSSFKIPFFTYDFSAMQGLVRLTNFM